MTQICFWFSVCQKSGTREREEVTGMGGEMQEGKEMPALWLFLRCKGWDLFKMETACDSRSAKFRRVQFRRKPIWSSECFDTLLLFSSHGNFSIQ